MEGSEGGYETVATVEKGSLERRVALLVFCIFSVITLFDKRRKPAQIQGLLGYLILSFILWAFMSIAWADDPSLVARRVLVLGILSIAALSTASCFSLFEIVNLTFFICAFTLLISICGEVWLGVMQPFQESYRFSGIMHPVSQGWNCSLLVISGVVLARNSNHRRPFNIIVALTAFVFLVFTKSRMSLAGTLIALLIAVGIGWSGNQRKKFMFAILFLGFLICLQYFILGESLIHQGKWVLHLGRGDEGLASVGTLSGRTLVWKELLRYAAENPILGYGYNAFWTKQHIYHLSGMAWYPSHSHSGYVHTLLCLGVVGLSMLILIFCVALKRSIVLLKRSTQFHFVCALLTWVIWNSFTESTLLTEAIFPTFLGMTLLALLGFFRDID